MSKFVTVGDISIKAKDIYSVEREKKRVIVISKDGHYYYSYFGNEYEAYFQYLDFINRLNEELALEDYKNDFEFNDGGSIK